MSALVPGRPIPKRAQEVIKRVAEETSISAVDLLGPRRTQRIATARFAAYAALYALGRPYSLPFIAAIFDRHHTTVLHGIRAHQHRS